MDLVETTVSWNSRDEQLSLRKMSLLYVSDVV